MSHPFIEYLKLHIISLEQDSAANQAEMDLIEDLDSDEYEYCEIQDISLNGQLIATHQLLEMAEEML